MTETMTMRTASQADGARALTESLQTFARVRNATIRMVANLTEEQAAFRPQPGAWSAAQILDHVLLTEALNRRQYQRMLDMARDGKRLHLDIGMDEVQFNLPFIPEAMMPMMTLPLTIMNMFIPPALREAALRNPIMEGLETEEVSQPAPAKPIAGLRAQLAESLAETEALFAAPLPAERVARDRHAPDLRTQHPRRRHQADGGPRRTARHATQRCPAPSRLSGSLNVPEISRRTFPPAPTRYL